MEKEFGEKIKYYRQQKGISRDDLSKILGISIHTLAKYEQGQREANYETLLKICDVLQISMFDIFENATFSDYPDIELCKKLKETTSAKELLEIAFLQNPYFSHKLEICTSSREEEKQFFNMFGEYIESYLKTQELLTMPWLEDDSKD